MSDLHQVLNLWQQIEASNEDCVLATIVRVDGSSYRKPGARMLITSGGLRAGTISGGCLEGEVSRQAWWLTENGPQVKAYSTSFEEDDDRPYGLGCGGTVHLLLERRQTADPFLRDLVHASQTRQPLACAVRVTGTDCGHRAVCSPSLTYDSGSDSLQETTSLRAFAQIAMSYRQSSFEDDGAVWAEFIPARCGLFIFGAGDDAKPLVTQASTLGWYITVADGRSHLATRQRFPEADDFVLINQANVSELKFREGDAAIVMTHSYERDLSILEHLLDLPIAYLGVLGPRYRTAALIRDTAAKRWTNASRPMKGQNLVHSPVGLDLGGDSPATIALAILAEIQATLCERKISISRPPKVQERNVHCCPYSVATK